MKLANPMPVDGALAIDSRHHAWGWGLDARGDLCLRSAIELRPAQLPLGEVTLATVEWSNGRTHNVVTANLSKARERGR